MSGKLMYYLPVLLWLCFGIWFIYRGLQKYRNAPHEKDYRYRKKSVEEFSRKFGILMAILGLLLILGAAAVFFGLSKTVRLALIILMLIDGIGLYLVYTRVLKPM
ncbi:MAG: hypothetical protein PHS19_02375 [Eubacteriales bacterium]|nr:hypothetical protein [Eubacteriales bacterium]